MTDISISLLHRVAQTFDEFIAAKINPVLAQADPQKSSDYLNHLKTMVSELEKEKLELLTDA